MDKKSLRLILQAHQWRCAGYVLDKETIHNGICKLRTIDSHKNLVKKWTKLSEQNQVSTKIVKEYIEIPEDPVQVSQQRSK